MFDVSESTWRPSASSASAKYSPSATQKSRLNRRFRSAACRSSCSANVGVLPHQSGQASAADLGVVGVALQLARGAREPGQAPVAVGDRVPRVLPALVLQPGLLVARAGRRRTRCPAGRRTRRSSRAPPGPRLQLAHQLRVAGPALVLVEQHHEQRRGVGVAVVRRVRPLLERGHLAVAHLVQDPARVLLAEVVDARCPAAAPARAASSRPARA